MLNAFKGQASDSGAPTNDVHGDLPAILAPKHAGTIWISNRPTLALKGLALTAGLLVTGAALLAKGNNLTGMQLLLFGFACGIFTVVAFFYRMPQVVLFSDGIRDLRLHEKPIPWEQIEKIGIVYLGADSYVALTLREPERFLVVPQTVDGLWLEGAGLSHVNIHARPLEITAQELAEFIGQRLQIPQAAESITTTVTNVNHPIADVIGVVGAAGATAWFGWELASAERNAAIVGAVTGLALGWMLTRGRGVVRRVIYCPGTALLLMLAAKLVHTLFIA